VTAGNRSKKEKAEILSRKDEAFIKSRHSSLSGVVLDHDREKKIPDEPE